MSRNSAIISTKLSRRLSRKPRSSLILVYPFAPIMRVSGFRQTIWHRICSRSSWSAHTTSLQWLTRPWKWNTMGRLFQSAIFSNTWICISAERARRSASMRTRIHAGSMLFVSHRQTSFVTYHLWMESIRRVAESTSNTLRTKSCANLRSSSRRRRRSTWSQIQSRSNWWFSCDAILRIHHFQAKPKMSWALQSPISGLRAKWAMTSLKSCRKWAWWTRRAHLLKWRKPKRRRRPTGQKREPSAESRNSSTRIMRGRQINPRNARLSCVKEIQQRPVLFPGWAKKTETLSVFIRWRENCSMYTENRRNEFPRIARSPKSSRFWAWRPERCIHKRILQHVFDTERCYLWRTRIWMAHISKDWELICFSRSGRLLQKSPGLSGLWIRRFWRRARGSKNSYFTMMVNLRIGSRSSRMQLYRVVGLRNIIKVWVRAQERNSKSISSTRRWWVLCIRERRATIASIWHSTKSARMTGRIGFRIIRVNRSWIHPSRRSRMRSLSTAV